MTYRRLLAFATIIAIVAVPLTSFADGDHARMLELSDLATEAVNGEQFERGAVKFREAYDTYPDPILLNNEMIAWFQAGDCSNALRASHRYLDTDDVEPEDLPTLDAIQKNCHLQLAQDAAKEENPYLTTYHLEQLSRFDLDDDDQDTYDDLRDDLAEIRPFDTDDDEPETFAHTSYSNTLHWAQISGGVAIAGIGAALHVVALDRQSQLRSLADSDDPHDATRFQQKQQDWGSYQRTTRWAVPTLYAVGALSIGSGIYFMARNRSASGLATVAPSVSTDRVGLSLSGRF